MTFGYFLRGNVLPANLADVPLILIGLDWCKNF
jgi:hypothetical protein